MAASNKSNSRRLLVAAVLAAMLFSYLLMKSNRAVPRGREPQVQQIQSAGILRASPDAAQLRKAEPARMPESAETARAAPPIIDEVRVEKESVCEGEENLITVRAHTTDALDADLRYVVGGEAGEKVPLRRYRIPEGLAIPNQIQVFTRGGVSTSVDVPKYAIRDCKPARSVVVTYRARANRVDEFDFSAILKKSASNDSFQPVWYVWDFGDGETVSTPQPFVMHSYARRTEKGLYSYYLVTVTAYGPPNDQVVGRNSVELLNLGRQTLLKFGIVLIATEGSPRFPVLSPDGVVSQRITLWHSYSEPVEIKRIVRAHVDAQGQRHEDGDVVDLAVLDKTTIEPGKSAEGQFELDTNRHPDDFANVFAIEGITADGKQARGEIYVMKPPPQPTRENSEPVQDPKMAAKIRMALKILGQPTVTQEDLWRLEREGKLNVEGPAQ